jgi:DNA invertase Pin-like site-specific DNA recombinase
MSNTKQTARQATGYTRVSTDLQAETGLSLSAQEQAIRAYCEQQGLDLTGLATDPGVSGGKPLATREGGQLAAKGGADIVATRLDRLFRDAADCLTTVRDWDKQGRALHLVNAGQHIDTSSPFGRFLLTIQAGQAEYEKALIGQRTKEGMAEARRQGVTTGQLRLGQRLSGKTDPRGRRLLEADPAEAATVQRIVALRRSGASLRRIAQTLAAEGRRPKRGSVWHASAVRAVLKRAA